MSLHLPDSEAWASHAMPHHHWWLAAASPLAAADAWAQLLRRWSCSFLLASTASMKRCVCGLIKGFGNTRSLPYLKVWAGLPQAEH